MKNLTGCHVSRKSLSPAERRIEAWPMVDSANIKDPEDRELYERRFQALCGYLNGERVADLSAKWNLPISEIYRMFRRALTNHPDGRIWGFRALIPGVHVLPYVRCAVEQVSGRGRAGYAGMLGRVFRLHPNVQQKVIETFLKLTPGPTMKRLPLGRIFEVFIGACRKDGVVANEYPFTVRNVARRSLGTYLRSLYKTDLRRAVAAQCGAEASRTLNTATENRLPVTVLLPYQRVGFDGHRIDAFFVVQVPHRKGGFVSVVVNRPWLLIIVDLATRAILGWVLSLEAEYTREDVLRCVRNAVEPSEVPQLTTPNLKFVSNGGMPCWVLPELRYAVWSELSYDNAKSNLSGWVRDQIISVVGGAVNPGPIATPEHQSIVERLFGLLEESSTHLMPNTTGSSPKDPRCDDPEAAARKHGINLTHLLELLWVSITAYNGTENESLGFRSPLEQLSFLVRQEEVLVRRILPHERPRLGLLNMKVTVTVRGNIRKGRRPYIQFERERYSSDVLGKLPDLIGKKLEIVVDADELRTVRAFLPTGEELGLLIALGGWGQSKHTLHTRRATNRLYSRKILNEAANPNNVHGLLDHLRENAEKSKKAASAYEKTRVAAELPEDFDPAPPRDELAADEPPPPAPEHSIIRKVRLY